MDELTEVLWEQESVLGRYEELKKAVESEGLSYSPIEYPLLDTISPTISQALSSLRDDTLSDDKRTKAWKWLVVALDPETAAEVSATAIVSLMHWGAETSYREVLNGIATTLRRQVYFEQWYKANKGEGNRALKFMEKRLSKLSRQGRYRWKKRFYDNINHYIKEERIAVGNWGTALASYILDTVVEAHSDIFKVRTVMNKPQQISYTDQFLYDAEGLLAVIAKSKPTLRPMLVPPRDWEYEESIGDITGGYYIFDEPVYVCGYLKHKFYPSNDALKALNVIQSTPWMINERAYEFCRQLQESGHDICPVVPNDDPRVYLDEFEWASLSDDEKRNVRQESKDRMTVWASQAGKARGFITRLDLAQMLMNAGNKFWQPHKFDFRGRVYPMNAELSSQSDSWAKGLMQFHEGRKLGDDGLEKLMIHAANTFGEDKLSLKDRIIFVRENITTWRIALMTFEGQCRLASAAAEPLPFLAVLWELDTALSMADYRDFVSHIPVAVDGTCNGLQILSLMGHDETGAKATNCTSDPERRDLYEEVANAVRSKMHDLMANPQDTEELEAARAWEAAMSVSGRKIVKRAVMTTPYGVTDQGIVEQLVKDRHCDELEIPESWDMTIHQGRNRLARWMSKWIIEARADVVREAMKIMDYLRDTTSTLAENDTHLSWQVHDGSEVEQRYVKMRNKNITTHNGRSRVMKTATHQVDVRKSQGGSAPNVVHSVDASMLRVVARRMAASGITSMAMIHDSYGCHASEVDTMQRIIRDEAVQMFKGDWLLEEFYTYLCEEYPALEPVLPEPPTQGGLDVANEVPKATYFFS